MSIEQTEKQELRPFHETIVEAIHGSRWPEVSVLFKLLASTKIPSGHDAILAALEEWCLYNFRLRDMKTGKECDSREIAKSSVLAQKQAAEEAATKKVEIPTGSH